MEPKSEQAQWPRELRYRQSDAVLTLTFMDGQSRSVSAQTLRENSPSAEVQGHGARAAKSISIDYPVQVERMVGVGRYAVRLVFDDGHDSGLFTWPLLYRLSEPI